MPATKSRISGGFIHLEEPKHEETPAYSIKIGGVLNVGYTDLSWFGSVGPIVHLTQTLRPPTQRPLSDEDFEALLVGLRTSVDTSARATETIGDLLKAITGELRSLRELKQAHRVLLIASLGSDKYRLRGPLPVELYFEEGAVVAHAPDLEEFGQGDTEYEALDDLRRAAVERFEFLSANSASLGPGLQQQLRQYGELMERSG